MEPGRFCHECGRELQALQPEAVERLNVAELERLRAEKARLSQEITALRDRATIHDLSETERRRRQSLVAAWQEVTAELTAKLDLAAARSRKDRRVRERRRKDRRSKERDPSGEDQRSGVQRRSRGRRTGRDRRDPFGTEDT
ncbi:MAG: hypothetical protein GTO05_12380 [Gemmatimonadales bacterium]|nr:hypothetical protein [Gemmatimonadales bacterium]